MFKFDKIKEQEKLSPKEIIQKIGEENIYFKYLGYYPEPNKKYKSPFSKDKTPSFAFKQFDSLIFKCFSTDKGGDCVKLVSELYNESYKDAIKRIIFDFKTGDTLPYESKILDSSKFVKHNTEIQVVLQPFNESDLRYWKQGNIDRDTLDFFNVKVAREVWLDKGEGFKYVWNYLPKNPIFRYLVNGRYKCYRPLEKDKSFKWLSNMTKKDWQGFNQLPDKNDVLIITKSMKDIMVWYKLGYPAVSPATESQVIKPEIFDYFYRKFDKIYLNYDFDQTGISKAMQYDVPKIFTFDDKSKDAFDLVKNIGFKNAKQKLIQQIN
jgi:hypothetical protein